MMKAQAKVAIQPYGATVDSKGILWAPAVDDGTLGYFDTTKPANVGTTRRPNPRGGYGIGMDRDQNVWVGGYSSGVAHRYTPDRSNGFNNLGLGYFTTYTNVGIDNGANGCQGRGIAADSRTMQSYWVWMACHVAPYIVRIPGDTPLPKGADQQVDGRAFPAIKIAGGEICGAGIDVEQNVWGIASAGAFATRIKVDKMGVPTPPNLAGNPGTGCPLAGGDTCSTAMQGVDAQTTAYTYSDFSGFGLRNFTIPRGSYTYVIQGCDPKNAQDGTKWMRFYWDADVPPNTSLSVRFRSGEVPMPDASWTGWSSPHTISPVDLTIVAEVAAPATWVQVGFDFTTMARNASPKLKGFQIAYECLGVPGVAPAGDRRR